MGLFSAGLGLNDCIIHDLYDLGLFGCFGVFFLFM